MCCVSVGVTGKVSSVQFINTSFLVPSQSPPLISSYLPPSSRSGLESGCAVTYCNCGRNERPQRTFEKHDKTHFRGFQSHNAWRVVNCLNNRDIFGHSIHGTLSLYLDISIPVFSERDKSALTPNNLNNFSLAISENLVFYQRLSGNKRPALYREGKD